MENITGFLYQDRSDRINTGNLIMQERKEIPVKEIALPWWERAQAPWRSELSSHIITRAKTQPCGYRCRDFAVCVMGAGGISLLL